MITFPVVYHSVLFLVPYGTLSEIKKKKKAKRAKKSRTKKAKRCKKKKKNKKAAPKKKEKKKVKKFRSACILFSPCAEILLLVELGPGRV